MKHSRSATENTWQIDQAARASRPVGGPVGGISGDHILHIPATRDVPLPEPVATDWLNGRPPGGWVTGFGFALLPPADGEWEAAAIRAGRLRERRAELALLAGTVLA